MMKGLTNGVMWFTAVAILVALPAVPAFAGTKQSGPKTTPATGKNSAVPAVPRAIPDLIGYGKFDPPNAKMFDMKRLTISGDIRVRPEFRENGCFGGAGTGSCTDATGAMSAGKSDQFFTQQLIRLGFSYDISDDVRFFVQPQVSSNFGANNAGVDGTGGVNPNGTGADLFLRQGYILVRNFVAPNLTMKAGRQLVVWGNHRIFGHFDWNNVGFAFDGVTFRYNHKRLPVEMGWLRISEDNIAQNPGGTNPAAGGSASKDGDIVFVRVPAKIGGVKVEPAWIWESGGAGAGGNTIVGGQPSNQSRHTVGGRVWAKPGMFDMTGEAYYQFGDIGTRTAGSSNNRDLDIDAYAFHFDAGVTLPVPMQPRIGAEINYASGDGDANRCSGASAATQNAVCNGEHNTFSQLFPTNHIHFGYMDLMAWQNMLTWGGNLQMRPTANSHLDIAGHSMRLADSEDNWYRANQGTYFRSPTGNNVNSLGWELDAVYTLFFQGNHVGWQVGYGHFFAGKYVEQAARLGGVSESDQDWGYTQLWINF